MHVFRSPCVFNWSNHGGPFALEASWLASKLDAHGADRHNDINNRLIQILEPMNSSELMTVETLLSSSSTVLSKWRLSHASS